MVTIYKDNNEKVVTMGAYDNFYKPLGYEIVKTQPLKKEENKQVSNTNYVKNKDESEKKTSKDVENKKR